MLYTLNFYSVVCQLYLSKTEGEGSYQASLAKVRALSSSLKNFLKFLSLLSSLRISLHLTNIKVFCSTALYPSKKLT